MKAKTLKKGFTLVEMILVITVLVITIAVTFTIQGVFLVDTFLDTNAEHAMEDLRLAQFRSITRQQDSTWGVHFETDQFIFRPVSNRIIKIDKGRIVNYIRYQYWGI